MITQDSRHTRNLDGLSGTAFAAVLLAALGIYFLWYVPGIRRAVESGSVPAQGILWLEIHIAVYWISYSLFFTGLVLAVIYFCVRATTRLPWVETATVIAAVLAVIGLITGILYSRPAWGEWWVWDVQHIFVLPATLLLLGISPVAALTRLCSNPNHRNAALMVVLFIAVLLCAGSVLAGFVRSIHPQWFYYELLQPRR
jgi:ABC-type transport system involved in cytochrome c biogenesis permease subunit